MSFKSMDAPDDQTDHANPRAAGPPSVDRPFDVAFAKRSWCSVMSSSDENVLFVA